ncbi:hypothetical protein LCGC14_0940040, partial [marine sediment metagenome]
PIGGPWDGKHLWYDPQQGPVRQVIIDEPDRISYDPATPVSIDPRGYPRGPFGCDRTIPTLYQYYPTWCDVPANSRSGFRGRRFLFLRFQGMDKQKAIDEFAERELGIVAQSLIPNP